MYKKILSLALALMLMGSCLCISVSAVPSQESVFKEAYDKGLVDLDKLYAEASDDEAFVPLSENEKLKIKCKTAYIEEYGITGEMAEYCSVPFAVQCENYTVFRVYPGVVQPMESFQYLDGYIFWEGNIIGAEDNNPTGLYTLDNYGNVEDLSATVNKSFIDLDELYPTLSEVAPMYISGDIDSDGRLTVNDATLIQKYLAKVPEAVKTVYEHRLGYCVMEVDEPWELKMFGGSSKVTVKDATYIQKKVAKMIFDEKMPPFLYDRICIWFNEEHKEEYTLADFPEYEFERLEQNDIYLTLYLKNPTKANAIDAVNSLKYREGTDFLSVNVEYIPTDTV